LPAAVPGAVALPRSVTQPFQVLWLLGVQTPLFQVAAVQVPGAHVPYPQVPQLFSQLFLFVYCDFVQALFDVQVLWVVWPGLEHGGAAVQVLWVL
jgi:hypothetical protein